MAGDTRAVDEGIGLATCGKDGGYGGSLVVGKSYVVLPDATGEALGWIRVIDKSGEDYLFPAGLFVGTGRREEPPAD